jgi:glycosyltransferase involved in cell wall biosynthesis
VVDIAEFQSAAFATSGSLPTRSLRYKKLRFPPSVRRPRVGVDFHTWDGIFQGSRSHILGLYREAIALAPDFDFIFFLDGTASLRAAHAEFSATNVELVSMPHRPGPWRLGVQLPRLQWKHRIDLLHMQYRLPFVRTGDCAVTIHDILFETHPQFFLNSYVWESKVTFRHAARHARVLFSVSEFSKQEIATRYKVPPERIHVTRNGVDAHRFHPATAADPRLATLGLSHRGYLLTVGRLEPRKNHGTLIQAYAQLPMDAPPLVIVGQRDFGYDPIFKRIREAGLQNRVRLLENVRDDLLPVIVRHARLFVFPAFAEGFGIPVAEAMASGVPVITSNTTALPEVAGAAVLYASPNDLKALARLMQCLLSDGKLSDTMAAKGVEQVTKFKWRSSAQVLLDAFREHFFPP